MIADQEAILELFVMPNQDRVSLLQEHCNNYLPVTFQQGKSMTKSIKDVFMDAMEEEIIQDYKCER